MKHFFSGIILSILLLIPGIGFAQQKTVMLYGLNPQQYQRSFDSLTPLGYMPLSINLVHINGTVKCAAIWEPNKNTAWESRSDLTEQQYQNYFNQFTPKGYVPYNITVYKDAQNQTKFAALWKKEPGVNFIARHGLSEEAYQKLWNELSEQNYLPYSIAVYEESGSLKFAAAWQKIEEEEEVDCIVRHHLSTEQSQSLFDELPSKGYIPLEITPYNHNGTVNFAVIWIKVPDMTWQVRHNINTQTLKEYASSFKSQGYGPYKLKAYYRDGNINYVAGWTKD